MFGIMDAQLERVPIIVVTDGDRLLQHDGAMVYLFIDEVHGHAGDLHAIRQRISDRMSSRERGEQGWMHIQHSAGIGKDKRWGDDPHEPRQHHDLDSVRYQQFEHHIVEPFPGHGCAGVDHHRLDISCTRALKGAGLGGIRHHQHDPRPDHWVIEQSLEIRSPTRGKDSYAYIHIVDAIGRENRVSTPTRRKLWPCPWTTSLRAGAAASTSRSTP